MSLVQGGDDMAFRFTSKTVKVKGKMRQYHIVEHLGAVAILALQDNKLTWVRQTRPATGEMLLEIPAGSLEAGEDPLECAKRELAEETGWRARQWHKLGGFYVAPGYSSEFLHIFLATDLIPGPQNLDEGEDIEVVELSVAEAMKMADTGRLRDGKSLAALFYLQRWLAR